MEIVREALSGHQRPLGRATSLPPSFYTDPDVYELEQRAVFSRAWLPVCRTDEIPGKVGYRPVSAGGVSLLLVRDEEGQVRLLVNACSHRSMILAESAADGNRVECAYHRWSYDLHGGLRSAPLAAPALDRRACAVPQVRHEVWRGWVFADLSGEAEPLAPQLESLDSLLDGWGVEDMVTVASREYTSRWNWKVMWENFNEFYHHIGTHRYSLEPLMPASTAQTLDNGGAPWSCTSMPCDPEYLAMQAFVDSAERPTDDMHLFSVFPLLCAGVQPGSAFWLQIIPESVDRHRVVWHLLLPSKAREERDFEENLEATLRGLDHIHREDMETCRMVDSGLRNPMAHPTVLTEWERPIWQLHHWLLDRMVAYERGIGAVDRSGVV